MRGAAICSLMLVAAAISADRALAQTYDPDGQKLVGRNHDANRAVKSRQELSLTEEVDRAHVRYAKAKKEIEDVTGVTFSTEASIMSQWGTSNGGYGAVQAMFTPAVSWDIISSPKIGDGSLQFHFSPREDAAPNRATIAQYDAGDRNLISMRAPATTSVITRSPSRSSHRGGRSVRPDGVSYREGNLMSGDLLTVSEGDSSEIAR